MQKKRLSGLGLSRLLALLRQALGGSDADYTQMSLGKSIFLLAIPMVMEMLMESIFAIVDIYFVSRLGAGAIATVGITESVLTLVYALSFGVSMATTAMVSRRIGEKDPRGAARSAMQAIYTGVALSLPIAVVGVLYYRQILDLMGLQNTHHAGYAAIMLGSNLSIMLLFIINSIFRSAGDPAISMRVLIFSNGLNLLLDPLFIFGLGPIPAMGVEGAALATALSRSLGVVYQLSILFSGRHRIRPDWSDLLPRPALIKQLAQLATGATMQSIIATSSWIGLIRILAHFGDEVVAGYTLGIRIVVFSLLPSWGVSNAASTLVGQNLGAGQSQRAERAAWIAAWANTLWMALLSALVVGLAPWLIGLFSTDALLIGHGSLALRIIGAGFVFYGFGMVMTNALNGAGDTLSPTWLNLFAFWLFEIPLAYLLALHVGWGQSGVYWAIFMAEGLLTIASALWFRQGYWKTSKV